MRLSLTEKQHILQTFSSFVKEKTKIYLFGSRIDDFKKGGDIDLLVLTDTPEEANTLLTKRHFMLSALKEHLGEQKIDILIRSKQEISTDAFLQSILQSAEPLQSS